MFTVAASATTAILHRPPLLVASRWREVVHGFILLNQSFLFVFETPCARFSMAGGWNL